MTPAPGNVRRWVLFTLGVVSVSWILMAMGKRWTETIMFGLLGTTVCAIGTPWYAFRSRRFWLAGPTGVVVFLLVFASIAAMAEKIQGRAYGDDNMVYLLPFMVFPVLMLVAWLLRIVIWLRGRTARSA